MDMFSVLQEMLLLFVIKILPISMFVLASLLVVCFFYNYLNIRKKDNKG